LRGQFKRDDRRSRIAGKSGDFRPFPNILEGDPLVLVLKKDRTLSRTNELLNLVRAKVAE
jgi:hypothetical protein